MHLVNYSYKVWFASSLRGWREKGAPTRTYPDHREQSWASIYTCLPLGPQSNGSGGHFTQEKQIVEKNNINKKGKCPNPLPSFTTVVSQTFFIIIMIIVYICSIKSMLIFCFLFVFLKKKKKGKIKILLSKIRSQTWRTRHFANHIILQRMQLVCVCMYNTERLHREMQNLLNH